MATAPGGRTAVRPRLAVPGPPACTGASGTDGGATGFADYFRAFVEDLRMTVGPRHRGRHRRTRTSQARSDRLRWKAGRCRRTYRVKAGRHCAEALRLLAVAGLISMQAGDRGGGFPFVGTVAPGTCGTRPSTYKLGGQLLPRGLRRAADAGALAARAAARNPDAEGGLVARPWLAPLLSTKHQLEGAGVVTVGLRSSNHAVKSSGGNRVRT